MIKWLICFLWGHKVVAKAFTGQTKRQLHAFRGEEDINFYKWQRLPFCIRCGRPNPGYKKDEEKYEKNNIA